MGYNKIHTIQVIQINRTYNALVHAIYSAVSGQCSHTLLIIMVSFRWYTVVAWSRQRHQSFVRGVDVSVRISDTGENRMSRLHGHRTIGVYCSIHCVWRHAKSMVCATL